MRNAAQDRNGFVNGRLRHDHRLEPALQRGVLFNVLAVFREGRRADDLNFSARERRLEDICRVHRPFGVARADQIVYLVDHKDDVAELFDLLDEALHAAFKLTAELRARDQRRQIHQIDLFVQQLIRNIAAHDLLREALGNGRLADARLADQTGIVFLTAVEDLHDALRLDLAADDAVKLAVARLAGQILAVGIEELVPLLALTGRLLLRSLLLFLLVLLCRQLAFVSGIAEKLIEEREGRRLALLLLVVLVTVRLLLLGGDHAQSAQSVGHFAAQIFQIVVRDAHALHQIVHGLDAKLPRTFEAEALVDGISVFNFCNENDRKIFLAS